MHVGCACSAAILDDVIGHFISILVTVVTMIRPASRYQTMYNKMHLINSNVPPHKMNPY